MPENQNTEAQKIEVIARYKELGLDIIKFRWNNTVYNVDRTPTKWKPKGVTDKTHFAVICENEGLIAELCYDHRDLKWELIQWDNLCLNP